MDALIHHRCWALRHNCQVCCWCMTSRACDTEQSRASQAYQYHSTSDSGPLCTMFATVRKAHLISWHSHCHLWFVHVPRQTDPIAVMSTAACWYSQVPKPCASCQRHNCSALLSYSPMLSLSACSSKCILVLPETSSNSVTSLNTLLLVTSTYPSLPNSFREDALLSPILAWNEVIPCS